MKEVESLIEESKKALAVDDVVSSKKSEISEDSEDRDQMR